MELPIPEQLLIFFSHILSLCLVLYISKKVDLKLGVLFFICSVLVYQQFYMVYFDTLSERTEGVGECWARLQDFYACMPLSERISIHAAQIGSVLTILCTFLLAKKAVINK